MLDFGGWSEVDDATTVQRITYNVPRRPVFKTGNSQALFTPDDVIMNGVRSTVPLLVNVMCD